MCAEEADVIVPSCYVLNMRISVRTEGSSCNISQVGAGSRPTLHSLDIHRFQARCMCWTQRYGRVISTRDVLVRDEGTA